MIEDFTASTFEPHRGDTFHLQSNGTGQVDLELVEISELGMGHPPSSHAVYPGRAPFSIVFLGPPEPILPQSIYRLAHRTLGAFDLFLVPIARDQRGVRYEAVFA